MSLCPCCHWLLSGANGPQTFHLVSNGCCCTSGDWLKITFILQVLPEVTTIYERKCAWSLARSSLAWGSHGSLSLPKRHHDCSWSASSVVKLHHSCPKIRYLLSFLCALWPESIHCAWFANLKAIHLPLMSSFSELMRLLEMISFTLAPRLVDTIVTDYTS